MAGATAGVSGAATSIGVRRLGGMLLLGGAVLRAIALRPPRLWRAEAGRQAWAVVRVSLPALLLAIAAWGFSGPGLQAGNFLIVLGSPDRAGGFMVVAILREFGTYVTATVVAGVVGTRFTAELAARRVRGELDALTALGVDPVRELVAPRVLAITVTMLGLTLLALVSGIAGGYLATVGVLDGTTGAFLASFWANTTLVDLFAGLLKVTIFGVLVGVICAWHGLNATGGALGVGRAVHRAVVGSLVAIFVVNLLYAQTLIALFPDLTVFR
jgi:phospholipid/cholesterol/gamma-HCH transport system permease protein